MKLSEHFTLGELTKTKYQTADGNIPSHAVIENLKGFYLAAFRGETAWESKEDRIPESIKKERLSGLSLCVWGVIRNR